MYWASTFLYLLAISSSAIFDTTLCEKAIDSCIGDTKLDDKALTSFSLSGSDNQIRLTRGKTDGAVQISSLATETSHFEWYT